jgi:hypothetical protein
MTIDKLIEKEGGLSEICKMFGWQGGTIHQAQQAIREKLAKQGIVEHKDTKELIQLAIKGSD